MITVDEGTGRTRLGTAFGLCEAGQRAVAVVPGDELAGSLDLLKTAVARLVPLVVRAPCTGGHAGPWAAADTGATVWFAQDPDELVRLELLAQRLAEHALVPFVLAHDGEPDLDREPLARARRELLGRAADFVRPATPAQELLFGRHRRRVPRWFDLERPVLRGADLEASVRAQREAARAGFFGDSVRQLLPAVLAEIECATGVRVEPIVTHGTARADVVVVAVGAAVRGAVEIAETVRKPKIGVIGVGCAQPLPVDLLDALRGVRRVLVIGAPLLREVRSMLIDLPDKKRPAVYGAHLTGGAPLVGEDLIELCAEIAAGRRDPTTPAYLGVDFASRASAFPKREVLHEVIGREYPGLADLGSTRPRAPAADSAGARPVRRPPGQSGTTHDRVNRFWDLFGAPWRAGAKDELVADPYLAADSVPALTSLCASVDGGHVLPLWKPELCTACGACWTACPDGAVLPAVLTPAALVDAGTKRARAAGGDVDALGMIAGRLGKAVAKSLRTEPSVGAAVRDAATPILDGLGPERADPMRPGCEALARALDPVRAIPFETDGFLTLAIDPDACKACEVCIAVCEPEALVSVPRDDDQLAAAQAGAAAWRELPDTSGAVIAAARERENFGVAAALSLSRHCLHALAPGDAAEPGSGEKIAWRQVLAACEAHLQPLLQAHVQDLDELQERFAGLIRDRLADALPTRDLDALASGLSAFDRDDVELAELATRLEDVAGGGHVDAGALAVRVETARALADLRWRVAQGVTGLGRARAGVAVAAGSFARTGFPWNPFAAPVAACAATGEVGAYALGLLRGQLQALCDDFALVRKARALLDGSAGAIAAASRPLRFTELTDDERRLCPPLLLVGDGELGRAGLAHLSAILGSALPLKVVVLESEAAASGPDLGSIALAHRDAFVVQSSIACADDLVDGTLAALRAPGPALIRVLAPSPGRDVVERAREPVEAGDFALLRRDPSAAPDDVPAPASPPEPVTVDRSPELAALRAEVEHELVQRLQRKLATLAGGRRS